MAKKNRAMGKATPNARTLPASLPASARVGGLTFRVIIENEKLMEAEGLRGDTDFEAQRIRVRAGMPPEITWRVFFHEVLHCLVFASGFNFDSEKEERLVRRLQVPFFELFLDNSFSGIFEASSGKHK